ncbi:3-(3-hydroxy-phenyl)propionate/3-hydroxycinnamic acid hydroxylase [Streptomyces microflavus]
MPIGGQALNLGLQDAVNLGWKLAAAARGRAPARLLDSYHEERHEVGRQVLSNIRAQARLLLGGPEVTGLRAVIGELLPYEAVRARLAGMVSGLDIRYGGALTDAGRPGGGPHRVGGVAAAADDPQPPSARCDLGVRLRIRGLARAYGGPAAGRPRGAAGRNGGRGGAAGAAHGGGRTVRPERGRRGGVPACG